MQTFRQAIRTRDFTLSAELKLDARSTPGSIVDQGRTLATMVDAVQVTDNPIGRVHMSPLVAAGVLLRHEIDPVLHMNCRDRNRVALHSDLLGAAALGVTSLLIMRGQKYPKDLSPKVKGVFDWGVNRLIADARAMRSDPGIPNPPDFFIGSIATAFDPNKGWEPKKMSTKADAGIKFVQTQLCFDIDLIKRYMTELIAAHLLERVSVVIGVAPIPSADIAEWLKANLRGSVVPEATIRRLRQAIDPRQEGIRICADLLQQLAVIPGVSGASIMSFGDAESVVQAVDESGLRKSQVNGNES